VSTTALSPTLLLNDLPPNGAPGTASSQMWNLPFSELRERYPLGLVTNGASCLQHEKLDRSGLRPFFDVVVVSAEFGTGKPDASIFRYALSRLAEPHEQAVMLGDSLDRDVDGALSAGLQAIWVNRLGHPRPANRREVVEVSTFGEAVATLNMALLG
jgi:putative hydrolase of the HAD superfamily